MNGNADLDLGWAMGALRRRWWIPAVLLFFTLLLIAIVFSLIPQEYQAETTLLVESPGDAQTSQINVLMAGERLALTYSQMILSRPVLEQVIDRLKLDLTPDELLEQLKVEPVRDTQLLRITATSTAPDRAAALADTLAKTFIEYLRQIATEQRQTTLAGFQQNIQALTTEVDKLRAQIDTLNVQRVELQTEEQRLETRLSENRNDIRSLQQTEQSVQLAQTQITDQIHVVEPARVVENGFNLPFLGTLTMLIDQELIAGGASYGQPNSDRTATAIGPMIIREAVLTEAAKRAGVRLTTEELVARVWVSAVPGTQLIEINASSEDAESAEGLANQIALVFMEQTQKQLGEPYRTRLEALQAQMTTLAAESAALQDEIKTNNAEINRIQGELSRLESDYAVKNENLRTWTTSYEELVFTAEQSSGSVIVTEPARVPESAAQNRLLYSTLAALVALAAGVALALVLDRWEDKLRDWEDVKGGLNLDVLGSISHIPTGPARPPYVIEDFRKLATSLRVLMREKNIRLLMVTSASAADGKSVVAAGLASALARGGSEVILIDADMRLPQQHRLFDLDATPGLSGLLEAGDLMGLLKPTRDRRLRLMTAGSTLEDPIELLTSERLQEVLEYLSDQADVVILDTPPVLSAADAAYLAPLVESAMVVVRAGQTQRQAALNAVESLRRAGGQVIGAALNDVPLNGSSYTYYATNHKESGLIGRLWNPVKKWLERPVRKGP